VRTQKLERFVTRFFSNFAAFLDAPRHPKWQQVNFAATLEGWQDLDLKGQFILSRRATEWDPVADGTSGVIKQHCCCAGFIKRNNAPGCE
jgi:hypothetical protein